MTELPAGQPSGATAECDYPLTYRGRVVDCVDRTSYERAQLGQERGGAGILLALFAFTTASAIAVRRNWAKAGPSA